jgi:uroporphyrinogen-III synthase
MIHNGAKTSTGKKSTVQILITQPKPESEKSPYFVLEKKYPIQLTFHPFIKLEPIPAREFRKQKIDITAYSAFIFTSRNAIDHFFRMCEEMKVAINQDNKYFCIAETVALYLQKFILYRKRKVFYGTEGNNKSLFDVINKHKDNEKFLYVCSENQQDNEIVNWLKNNSCNYHLAFMYRSVSNDVKAVMDKKSFDIICFFTPSGVRSLFENYPGFNQNGALIGAFGNNTVKAGEEAGLSVNIKAPAPQAPSMISALDHYLATLKKKK